MSSVDCSECRQRPATISYTEVVDGKIYRYNLCSDCARKKGVTASLAPLAGPLVNILMGLLEEAGDRDSEEIEGPVCPQCGMSYSGFRRSGRLGCGACYDAFSDELRPLLRRVHGSTRHSGRVPTLLANDFASLEEIRKLKADLDAAVKREEYERAAEIRDLIRAREAELDASGKRNVDV